MLFRKSIHFRIFQTAWQWRQRLLFSFNTKNDDSIIISINLWCCRKAICLGFWYQRHLVEEEEEEEEAVLVSARIFAKSCCGQSATSAILVESEIRSAHLASHQTAPKSTCIGSLKACVFDPKQKNVDTWMLVFWVTSESSVAIHWFSWTGWDKGRKNYYYSIDHRNLKIDVGRMTGVEKKYYAAHRPSCIHRISGIFPRLTEGSQ